MGMKLLTILLLLAVNVALYSQTKPDSLTIEKAISRYRISNPRISPDEKRVAFVVIEPIKGNTSPNSDIWMYELESKKLTNSPGRLNLIITRNGRPTAKAWRFYLHAVVKVRFILSRSEVEKLFLSPNQRHP